MFLIIEEEKNAVAKSHDDIKKLSILSNKALVPKVSRELIYFLHSHNETKSDAFQVAFEEALTNAIVHGNKNDINKNVNIVFSINEEFIEVTIEDEGNGFDFIMAIIGLTETQEDIFRESGRGIFLISLYTDDFYFENNGSKIVMIKKRAGI